ncbi:MAG: hypothetical protein ACTSWN_02455 [Promethearchaeota archaeon]
MPFVKLVAGLIKIKGNVPVNEFEKIRILYPSTVVREFFNEQEEFSPRDFVAIAVKAMQAANERVKEKYGFYCFGCTYYELELKKILKRKNIDKMLVKILKLEG